MTTARRVSYGASKRLEDLSILSALLGERLHENEREIFQEMLEDLTAKRDDERHRHQLSEKQRAWVKRRLEYFRPTYENAWSAGKVPRGREVPTPEVLRHLPKRPPGR